MKNLIHIALVFFMAATFTSCEKTQVSTTPNGNLFAGKKYSNIEVQFYEITPDDKGSCTGWYLRATNVNFEFLVQVMDELPDFVTSLENPATESFMVDFEFTGQNYYCYQPVQAKVEPIGSYDNYPFEVQKVIVSKIKKNEN